MLQPGLLTVGKVTTMFGFATPVVEFAGFTLMLLPGGVLPTNNVEVAELLPLTGSTLVTVTAGVICT